MEVKHRTIVPDDSSEPLLNEEETSNGTPPGASSQSATSRFSHLLKLAMERWRFLALFLMTLLYLAFRSGSSGNDSAPPSLTKAFVTWPASQHSYPLNTRPFVDSLKLVKGFDGDLKNLKMWTNRFLKSEPLKKMRHGTRAPGFTYNTDPYNRDDENIWPDGAGELTKAGKQEAYELGGNLKARYREFIGDYYKPKDFKAYSSQTERTIMSAQLVLASFFLPKGYQDWNSGLTWQPIPVYNDDLINSSAGVNCPRFATEQKLIFNTMVPADVGLTSEELRIFVENTGEDKVSPYSLAVRVWDSVYFQDRANLPVPKWIQPLFPEKMNALGLKFVQKYLTGTETQKQLVLDPHGRGLVNFFNESPRKLEFHSGHDINIISLFTLLGIKIDSFPQPACAIAVELHHKDSKDYFEVYYFPDSKSKQPIQMKMACGVSCPLSELIDMAKTYYVDNYHELCYSSDEKPENPLGFKTGSQ